MEKKYRKFYSLGEEIANSVTHGVATLLALAGGVIAIVVAAKTHDPYKIVAASIYAFSLVVLYLMSTLYHSLPNGKAKFVFRVFDHDSIFLLIAGSYTPFTLVTLRGTLGWWMFGAIWASAICGIVLNSISVDKYAKISILFYVAMGWCVIIAIKPLIAAIDLAGLVLLVAGGLCYTIGIIFFVLRTKYMHSIWHVFVLAGSVLQYFTILFYVL